VPRDAHRTAGATVALLCDAYGADPACVLDALARFEHRGPGLFLADRVRQHQLLALKDGAD
jgi:hypothetical protein